MLCRWTSCESWHLLGTNLVAVCAPFLFKILQYRHGRKEYVFGIKMVAATRAIEWYNFWNLQTWVGVSVTMNVSWVEIEDKKYIYFIQTTCFNIWPASTSTTTSF